MDVDYYKQIYLETKDWDTFIEFANSVEDIKLRQELFKFAWENKGVFTNSEKTVIKQYQVPDETNDLFENVVVRSQGNVIKGCDLDYFSKKNLNLKNSDLIRHDNFDVLEEVVKLEISEIESDKITSKTIVEKIEKNEDLKNIQIKNYNVKFEFKNKIINRKLLESYYQFDENNYSESALDFYVNAINNFEKYDFYKLKNYLIKDLESKKLSDIILSNSLLYIIPFYNNTQKIIKKMKEKQDYFKLNKYNLLYTKLELNLASKIVNENLLNLMYQNQDKITDVRIVLRTGFDIVDELNDYGIPYNTNTLRERKIEYMGDIYSELCGLNSALKYEKQTILSEFEDVKNFFSVVEKWDKNFTVILDNLIDNCDKSIKKSEELKLWRTFGRQG